MTQHLTPEAIARAKAEAQDREAERIKAEREARQLQRQSRHYATYWPPDRTKLSVAAERRAARLHAETWWQALRRWEVRNTCEIVPRTRIGSGGEGAMKVVGVGNYGRLAAVLRYPEVLTPIGWISERAVGRIINDLGSEHLERLRGEAGLTSLLRPEGRFATGGAEAARDVLELAELLGDERAEASLACLLSTLRLNKV